MLGFLRQPNLQILATETTTISLGGQFVHPTNINHPFAKVQGDYFHPEFFSDVILELLDLKRLN